MQKLINYHILVNNNYYQIDRIKNSLFVLGKGICAKVIMTPLKTFKRPSYSLQVSSLSRRYFKYTTICLRLVNQIVPLLINILKNKREQDKGLCATPLPMHLYTFKYMLVSSMIKVFPLFKMINSLLSWYNLSKITWVPQKFLHTTFKRSIKNYDYYYSLS